MTLPRVRLLALLTTLGVVALTGSAQAATFVQGTSSSTSGTSMPVAYPANVAAGHLLVGMFRASGTTSVSDSRNGAWTRAATASDGINSIWYRANAAAGATTVTVSGTTSGSIRAVIAEYSGVATSAPLDATACNTGTGTTATTGTTASVPAGELAFAGLGSFDSGITVSAGTGATLRNQFTGTNGTSADEDVASTTAGTQNKSFTLNPGSTSGWAACIATFKPPSGGTPPADWVGSFTGGISSSLYPYQSFVAGHVFSTADPAGSGKQVGAFAIANSDQPYAGAPPRGDLFSYYDGSSNPHFTPGKDYFIAIPVRIPSGLPLMYDNASKFFQWAQIDYPGNDQPSIGLSIGGGEAGFTTNHFTLEMYDNGAFDYPWYGPAVDGNWHTAILSVHFATDNTGSVKLWFDGVPQTFSNGSTTFNGPTLTVRQDGVTYDEALDIDSYRALDAMPGTVTIYHGAPAIGPTYDSVNNTLARPPTGP
jgi:Polysaccharide lyase